MSEPTQAAEKPIMLGGGAGPLIPLCLHQKRKDPTKQGEIFIIVNNIEKMVSENGGTSIKFLNGNREVVQESVQEIIKQTFKTYRETNSNAWEGVY